MPPGTEHPATTELPLFQSFDIPDHPTEQIHLRKEWDEKMKRLDDKYGPDYYFSSESKSGWDEEEPKYETLI